MKYIGKIDTPIAGAEIRENERFIPSSNGRQVTLEFEVYIDGKFKARFKQLGEAITFLLRSCGIPANNNDFNKWFEFK